MLIFTNHQKQKVGPFLLKVLKDLQFQRNEEQICDNSCRDLKTTTLSWLHLKTTTPKNYYTTTLMAQATY
jgi:hypothetical protein